MSEVYINEPNPNWRQDAACRGVDPELFFPKKGESNRDAKKVCRGCSVKNECLEYALINQEKLGIWGEANERERRILRRQRLAAISARIIPVAQD